ncbi:MAG: phosphoribosylformylglycinamidine synthase subunit PurQ [Flavobacteriia bacterium]|nr:phosphoribosylformylglycinamidine synthase subunit PurQ [Flavobacteriia bacterium]NBV91512.1 phosphoribosylformylglycinamidine synthase subunit PurQ [Flavobacteriia bacterium]
MKFGVVTFPGSNCDQDMVYVLKDVLGQEVVSLWHKDTDLQGVDMVVLPGGFSYGDYLRSGAIAKFSPIMNEVIQHAGKGGYVLGICNGFQILTESGLLPGALLHNANQKFICKNVYITPNTLNSPITKGLVKNEVYKIPIAHGEGRYYADEATLENMQANDQILFKYCRVDGKIDEAHNPNGTIQNIAGVTNATKNVFGMMPHPERASDVLLGNVDGKALFESLLNFC